MSPIQRYGPVPKYLPLPARDRSVLLVIDVQESLVKAIEKEIVQTVIEKISLLVKVAKRLEIPIIWTEQYPKGLKETVEPLKSLLKENARYMEKKEFSCILSDAFREVLLTLPSKRKTFVLTGIETHVCILQTAVDMIIDMANPNVYVVADATCSRKKFEHKTAIKFMNTNGVGILTTESIIFSWLEKAGTPEFKEVLSMIK